MNRAESEFSLPSPLRAEAATRLIGERWSVVEEPEHPSEHSFYDTFDWSLWSDGGILDRRRESGVDELVWTAIGGESDPLTQPCTEDPAFAQGLAPGPVRERIRAPAGIRRLLPVMRIQSRERILRLLDDEDKTVARVVLAQDHYRDPVSGAEDELPWRIKVLALRGYDRERDSVLRMLSVDLELEKTRTPRMIEALEAAGRSPGDYSSKIDFTLDPRERSDQVTKTILRGLLRTLERNIPGARANLDTEFLHDLRVAVRRTRSALTQIRDVFPQPLVEHFKDGFGRLQQMTGPVRDLDVYLLDFDRYKGALPEPLAGHLEPMHSFLCSRHAEEQQRLAEALGSREVNGLIGEWRAFLESPVPAHPQARDAAKPIKILADARIWRMAKRVRREGLAIKPGSPPTEMHELRKSCKKLRYLMEFFQSLYPEDEVRTLVKVLKRLLDNLGDFQDAAVQADHLRELAAQMQSAGRAESDTLLAMGVLIGGLFERQRQARHEFAQVFAEFAAQTQQQIRALFRPGAHGGEPIAAAEAAP